MTVIMAKIRWKKDLVKSDSLPETSHVSMKIILENILRSSVFILIIIQEPLIIFKPRSISFSYWKTNDIPIISQAMVSIWIQVKFHDMVNFFHPNT